jgi:inner membrane protein
MGASMLSWIGWVATAVFASSYLCREPATLRRVQAGAAVLWVVYGLLIHAAPVVVANLIVATVALVSLRRWAWGREGVSGKRESP